MDCGAWAAATPRCGKAAWERRTPAAHGHGSLPFRGNIIADGRLRRGGGICHELRPDAPCSRSGVVARSRVSDERPSDLASARRPATLSGRNRTPRSVSSSPRRSDSLAGCVGCGDSAVGPGSENCAGKSSLPRCSPILAIGKRKRRTGGGKCHRLSSL